MLGHTANISSWSTCIHIFLHECIYFTAKYDILDGVLSLIAVWNEERFNCPFFHIASNWEIWFHSCSWAFYYNRKDRSNPQCNQKQAWVHTLKGRRSLFSIVVIGEARISTCCQNIISRNLIWFRVIGRALVQSASSAIDWQEYSIVVESTSLGSPLSFLTLKASCTSSFSWHTSALHIIFVKLLRDTKETWKSFVQMSKPEMEILQMWNGDKTIKMNCDTQQASWICYAFVVYLKLWF